MLNARQENALLSRSKDTRNKCIIPQKPIFGNLPSDFNMLYNIEAS